MVESVISNDGMPSAANIDSTQSALDNTDFALRGENEYSISDAVSDFKIEQENINSFGSMIAKDFNKFIQKMNLLKQDRFSNAGKREFCLANEATTHPNSWSKTAQRQSTTPSQNENSLDQAIATFERSADYAAYLSATAALSQGAVNSAKRLQQG